MRWITSIQDYLVAPYAASTTLTSGESAVYFGGPTFGWIQTSSDAPDGTAVLDAFAEASGADGKPLPAVVNVRGSGAHLLLFSVHLEATEGVGVSGDMVTAAQREEPKAEASGGGGARGEAGAATRAAGGAGGGGGGAAGAAWCAVHGPRWRRREQRGGGSRRAEQRSSGAGERA